METKNQLPLKDTLHNRTKKAIENKRQEKINTFNSLYQTEYKELIKNMEREADLGKFSFDYKSTPLISLVLKDNFYMKMFVKKMSKQKLKVSTYLNYVIISWD